MATLVVRASTSALTLDAPMQWRERHQLRIGGALHIRGVVGPTGAAVLLLHGLGVGGSICRFARRCCLTLAAVAPDLRGTARATRHPVDTHPSTMPLI